MSVEVQDLKKSFFANTNSKLEILKGLNFKVQTGEVVAIVGQSGSGKSTLLSLLAGLDSPDSGKILIEGQNIVTQSEEQLTNFRGKNIGIVFQQYHLVPHLTALENVLLPLEISKNKNKDLAKSFLEKVGMDHRLSHYPSQMSGGECQRVAIARAMVTTPSFVLADEPTGSLDTNTGKRVMDLFFDTVRGERVTTVLVTHSPEIAALCDRILTLDQGVIA